MKTLVLTENQFILLRDLIDAIKEELPSTSPHFHQAVVLERKFNIPEIMDLKEIDRKLWEK